MAECQRHHLPPESPPRQQQPQNYPPPPKMSPEQKRPKNKDAYSNYYQTSDSYRAICTCLTIVLLVLGAIALTLWLIYRPHKPQFTVAAAAIYSLNATSPPSQISTTMQFTIVTRNPNHRVSIRYDRLQAFVAYRNQAITQQVMLPPLAHRRRSSVAVSPVLGGVPVPVSAEVVNGLMMDEAYGVVRLRVVVVGRLRWKITGLDIRTGHYGIYVKCDVLVGLKKGFVGQVPLLGTPACKVDI
ncbi:NDR1/HIN1-like protein 1 [Argentina anserina]|uniref:NDR1/HIN1-like protein 1 n=1 Tax=Argentina anserina TaxID=57926 RepID=UPI002176718B|nr:NDR1/HIN1-like protein 1 [Potentilla anserina]